MNLYHLFYVPLIMSAVTQQLLLNINPVLWLLHKCGCLRCLCANDATENHVCAQHGTACTVKALNFAWDLCREFCI